jgi:hypothetical protein
MQIENWHDAEVNAAAWMRHWVFVDALVAPHGPDGGVHLVSDLALAHVERIADMDIA